MSKVYVDFGVRKAHTILIGTSDEPTYVNSLSELRLTSCEIFIEVGCPRRQLQDVMDDNRVFMIEGTKVKERRECSSQVKSDIADVFAIRYLAEHNFALFKELRPEEKENIRDSVIYAYHSKLGGLAVALANRQRSFQREFGEPLPQLANTIRALEREKRTAALHFRKFHEKAKSIAIRGVGEISVAGVLALANPNRFPSLSSYLRYCGLKGSARASGRYNRQVRALLYQLAASVIMKRDPQFYPLYRRIKERLRGEFPLYPRYRIDGMARNRLSTLLAKRLFEALRAHPFERESDGLDR